MWKNNIFTCASKILKASLRGWVIFLHEKTSFGLSRVQYSFISNKMKCTVIRTYICDK